MLSTQLIRMHQKQLHTLSKANHTIIFGVKKPTTPVLYLRKGG